MAEPAWTRIPFELARFAATPGGLHEMFKARERGALFRPEAQVIVRGGRFVAVVGFRCPIGPERQDSVAFLLQPFPEER